MPANVESFDRLMRIAVGIMLLAAVFVVAGSWRWAGRAGLLPLVSGIVGWCPFCAWITCD